MNSELSLMITRSIKCQKTILCERTVCWKQVYMGVLSLQAYRNYNDDGQRHTVETNE